MSRRARTRRGAEIGLGAVLFIAAVSVGVGWLTSTFVPPTWSAWLSGFAGGLACSVSVWFRLARRALGSAIAGRSSTWPTGSTRRGGGRR